LAVDLDESEDMSSVSLSSLKDNNEGYGTVETTTFFDAGTLSPSLYLFSPQTSLFAFFCDYYY